jgi:CRISPR system Cascade subunit CasD
MPSLLLRLSGPMQSWGTTSRFDQRDTGKEPSKSGILGLLAAALGIDRENWTDLEPLTRLSMIVRHDRAGSPKRDYQTAGCAAGDAIVKADGKLSTAGGVVSYRYYLADAAFLVVLGGEDRALLERANSALRNPKWPLALGRKSYVASEPIWVDEVQPRASGDVVRRWPWISAVRRWESPPDQLLISSESEDNSGVQRMDQPLSSFGARRFGSRFVRSEWIPFPSEGNHAVA